MTTQVAITEEFGRNSLKRITIHDTEVLGAEARLAVTLIERWGLVTGKIDGEDSSGRAVLKECSPSEVVQKACETADLAMKSFRERGWLVVAPDISELHRKTDD